MHWEVSRFQSTLSSAATSSGSGRFISCINNIRRHNVGVASCASSYGDGPQRTSVARSGLVKAASRSLRAGAVTSALTGKNQPQPGDRIACQAVSANNVEVAPREASKPAKAASTSTLPKGKATTNPQTTSLTKPRPSGSGKVRLSADEKELRLIQLETAADPMASQLASDLPTDIIDEFEKRLEADIETVATTLVAITGVIVFWRGVWSVLDHFIGDSLFGDICCILVGLSIIFWIRLSGARLADFWPGA